MSLDVYLYGDYEEGDCTCSCGNCHKTMRRDEMYSANTTHNLAEMAREAGIYMHLWRPEEIGITKAEQLATPLRDALNLLRSAPERFKKFNPDNGWGSYSSFVSFVLAYTLACEGYPTANIEVSR